MLAFSQPYSTLFFTLFAALIDFLVIHLNPQCYPEKKKSVKATNHMLTLYLHGYEKDRAIGIMLRNFGWLVKGKIAGAALPDSPDSFSELWNSGVRAIVSLVEWPVDEQLIRGIGFEYLHLKIPSYMPPTQEQIDKFIDFVERMEGRDRPIVVCCRMGWGRTGSMLASYLVRKGFGSSDAIREVRKKRPRSIESAEQEAAVREYAARLKTLGTE